MCKSEECIAVCLCNQGVQLISLSGQYVGLHADSHLLAGEGLASSSGDNLRQRPKRQISSLSDNGAGAGLKLTSHT